MLPARRAHDPDVACRTSGRQPASVRQPGTSARRAANRRRRRARRSGSIFRITASRRSRSARLAQAATAPTERRESSVDRRANRRENRGAAAARRVLPTFERRAQDHAKRPAAVPRGGGASFATSDRAVRRPNRCRLSHGSIQAAAGSVSTRRGGTFGRVAKREAGADEPRRPRGTVGGLSHRNQSPRRLGHRDVHDMASRSVSRTRRRYHVR